MKGSITMKKTTFTKSAIAVLSAAVMTALSATPAFAQDFDTDAFLKTEGGVTTVKDPSPTSTGEVKIKTTGNKVPDDPTDAVYLVEVTWKELNFTYTRGTWDTENRQYADSGWDQATISEAITVENSSNWGVTLTAKFTNGSTTSAVHDGVTATVGLANGSNASLAACPNNASAAEIPTAKYDVGVEGDPNSDYANFTAIDTITVTITPTAAAS